MTLEDRLKELEMGSTYDLYPDLLEAVSLCRKEREKRVEERCKAYFFAEKHADLTAPQLRDLVNAEIEKEDEA